MNIDPTLRAFLPVLAMGLGGALVLILLTSLVLRRKKPDLVKEIWLRYLVWVFIAAFLIGALALGREAWIIAVGLLALAAFREYSRAVGLWMDVTFQAVVMLFIGLLTLCVWFPYPPAPGARADQGWYGLFMVMPVYGTLFIMAVPVFRGVYEHMIQKVALAILALIYFGWFLGHYGFLINIQPGEQANGIGAILFFSVLVALNDVGAFVAGRLLGRHKLSPKLSPGKTWEGAIGAVLIVAATAYGLRWLVPYYPVPHLVVVAILISVGGIFGDLVLSVIKRDLGIKDWGTILPGHGGILDRANSLIFSAPIFFHFTRYFFDPF